VKEEAMNDPELTTATAVATLVPPEPDNEPAARPPPGSHGAAAEAPAESGLTPIGVLVTALLRSLRPADSGMRQREAASYW
jgi:hypothetical protein